MNFIMLIFSFIYLNLGTKILKTFQFPIINISITIKKNEWRAAHAERHPKPITILLLTLNL